MTFVIVGGGRVGLRTARTLVEEGYDVTIVEADAEKAGRIEEEGFTVVVGDGADAEVLEAAGLEAAEAIAGLTGDLNVNFAACMLGAEFGCRTVLRIDEDYREAIYTKYADEVDDIIYPEQLGGAGAKTALLGGNFNLLSDLTEGLQLATVTIPEGSPVVGQRVTDLEDLLGVDAARIYAHGHAHEPMTLPMPGVTVDAGDRIALIAERDAVGAVREALLGEADIAEA